MKITISKPSKEVSCGNKYQHKTQEAAERHKARLEKLNDDEYNVYPCEYCEHYHVGHIPKALSFSEALELISSLEVKDYILPDLSEMFSLHGKIECACKAKEKQCNTNCPCFSELTSGGCECRKYQ